MYKQRICLTPNCACTTYYLILMYSQLAPSPGQFPAFSVLHIYVNTEKVGARCLGTWLAALSDALSQHCSCFDRMTLAAQPTQS